MIVVENFSIAQAAAIHRQSFTAVGAYDELLRLAGPNTQVLEKDYWTIPEEQIRTIQPRRAIFDGKFFCTF